MFVLAEELRLFPIKKKKKKKKHFYYSRYDLDRTNVFPSKMRYERKLYFSFHSGREAANSISFLSVIIIFTDFSRHVI